MGHHKGIRAWMYPCRSFTFTWIAKHTNRSKVIEESLVYINADTWFPHVCVHRGGGDEDRQSLSTAWRPGCVKRVLDVNWRPGQ